jgi:hypothetical protein
VSALTCDAATGEACSDKEKAYIAKVQGYAADKVSVCVYVCMCMCTDKMKANTIKKLIR